MHTLLPSSSECSPQKITKHIVAKGDSGASNHCVRPQDSHILNDTIIEHGPAVQQPDNSTLKSSGSGQLPLSDQLSTNAKKAIALPNLKNSSLTPLGQLCDDGCNVNLCQKKLVARKNDNMMLRGERNHRDGLWDMPIQKTELQTDNYKPPPMHAAMYSSKKLDPQRLFNTTKNKKKIKLRMAQRIPILSSRKLNHLTHRQLQKDQKTFNTTHKVASLVSEQSKLNVIICKKQPKVDLAKYLHASCYSPKTSTWTKAIKNNNFPSWPGLTTIW